MKLAELKPHENIRDAVPGILTQLGAGDEIAAVYEASSTDKADVFVAATKGLTSIEFVPGQKRSQPRATGKFYPWRDIEGCAWRFSRCWAAGVIRH